MKTVVVIPAFNEAKVIGQVLMDLRALYEDIVVVDDASNDDTAAIAASKGVHTVRHMINRGQGAALKTGIVFALQQGADVIVTFDADGQHLVSDIKRLAEPVMRGEVDVVLGSRFLAGTAENIPALRKVVLKLAIIFTAMASGLRLTDTHNGLRAFSRNAAKTIRIRHDRMSHASEILDEIARNKLRYREVPVTVHYSDYSKAKGQSSFAFAKILLKYFVGRFMQ